MGQFTAQWDEASYKLRNQSRVAEAGEVLLPMCLLKTLLMRLESYLAGDGDAMPLVEIATAIASHSKHNQNSLGLASFIVRLLQERGVQAELVEFPNGPQVVVAHADTESDPKDQ